MICSPARPRGYVRLRGNGNVWHIEAKEGIPRCHVAGTQNWREGHLRRRVFSRPPSRLCSVCRKTPPVR